MPTPGPTARDLARFLRGELSRDEVREVVRHLLRRADPGRNPMTRENSPVHDAEAAARVRLKEIAEELKALEKKLRGIHKSLAPTEDARAAAESDADNDVSTEIRSVIECVLADSLGPAIRDLQAAASYLPSDSP
jgi:hypothetical protein